MPIVVFVNGTRQCLIIIESFSNVPNDFMRRQTEIMWKDDPHELFQEEIIDWMNIAIEASETKHHELNSIFKLKMCINDIKTSNKLMEALI